MASPQRASAPGSRGPIPKPPAERFVKYVANLGTSDDECWLWTGGLASHGYGHFSLGRQVDGRYAATTAHRFAYELWVGPIPAGLHLDHLCRTPRCVNPRHLEPVTSAENTRRGQVGAINSALRAKQTHCWRGHPLPSKRNANGERKCKPCGAIRQRESRARRAAG